MANKITIDYTTDIGKVRLLIKDNKPDDPLFLDEEITAFLNLEGSVRYAAAAACEALATEFAGAGQVNIERGNLIIDRGKAAERFRMMAQTFREREQTIPYSDYQELEDESLENKQGMSGYFEEEPEDSPEE
jgi:hypothetical protein